MFRFNLKRNIFNVSNFSKSSIKYCTKKPLTPYREIINKFEYCDQSSLVPWILGLTTIGFTSFALSYHYNKEVRKGIKTYLSPDVSKVLHEYLGPSNMTNIKKKIEDLEITNKIPWFSTSKVSDNKSSVIEEIKPISTENKGVKKIELSDKASTSENVASEIDRSLQINSDYTTKASGLLSTLNDACDDTISSLIAYETKIKDHSQKLKIAIEDDGGSKHNPWEDVNAASHQQQTAKAKTENEMKKLEILIKKLEEFSHSGAQSLVLKSNKSIKEMQETTANIKYRISQMQADIEKAQFNAQITNQYKELIQQGRERFKQELASLSPNVSSWTKKRADKLNDEDLNTLIIHAHRRIYQLQARIAELESMDAIRLESALKEQQKVDAEATADAINRELDRERSKLMMEKQAELESLKQDDESFLRKALTRQATAHSEHLTQLMKIQREEIENQMDLYVREALVKERERMRAAIEGWRMRVEGLEAAVEGRADEERLSREAQDLWVACHALQGVLSGPGPTPPLARFISSFEEAAQPSSLPIVKLFLSSVPETALTEGVCTKDVLTKRFEKVKKTCQRVAMIDETSGSLAMYLVSWIRSMFIVTQSCLIERETVVDPINDQIDTHQILASAELAIWRQDVDLAIRLLNLLRGMPRAVAHDWINDARDYLETKLAAEALGSYTSSKTAGSIPGDVS